MWRVLRAVFAPLFANEPLPSNAPETALFTMAAKGGPPVSSVCFRMGRSNADSQCLQGIRPPGPLIADVLRTCAGEPRAAPRIYALVIKNPGLGLAPAAAVC